MTQDEIIDLAELAGYESLIKFAKLVAATEREACAKVCEDDDSIHVGGYFARKIRARGEA